MKNATLRSLDLAKTKTRIMATVGPSSMKYEVLREMVQSGVTFFRFNGAHIEKSAEKEHLSYRQAEEISQHIRRLRSEFRQLISIYFDLGGPKIRVLRVLSIKATSSDGKAKGKCLQPTKGETVVIHAHNKEISEDLHSKLTAFEKRSKGKPGWDKEKSIWAQADWIKGFFHHLKKTSSNELMLGHEVRTFADFDERNPIYLKDGWCQLKIVKKYPKKLICEVEYVDSKFEFRPEQGANPQRHIFQDIITSKDKQDIDAALRMGADVISLSFVCSSSDANDLREEISRAKTRIRKDQGFMKGKSALYYRYISDDHEVPIFAKIETAFAVIPGEARKYAKAKSLTAPSNDTRALLAKIAERFDGLMVARGDLAVEVEKYRVPEIQRQIIEIAHLKNRPVIVATEMLESMKRGDASTRAEISDINTAVHQEADILMLSGETAFTKGKPAEAVTVMRKSIEQAELERLSIDNEKSFEDLQRKREQELLNMPKRPSTDKSLSILRLAQGNQICVSARALPSEVIITSVRTGQSTQEIAYYCPRQKILAITDDTLMGVRLMQHRGIYPVVMERPLKRTLDEFIDITNEINHELELPQPKGSGRSFRVPGLVRIKPGFPNGRDIGSPIPNSIHVFTFPVKKRSVPEVERKYILSEESYCKLTKSLKHDAERWRLLEQTNFFFTDEKEVVFKQKGSIRVRVERLAYQYPDAVPTALHSWKIFLTLKGKGRRSALARAEERPEKEFDVTAELIDKIIFSAHGPESLDFSTIPVFYRDYVRNSWKAEFKRAYREPEVVTYKQITQFTNNRHSLEMWNGFVLELDQTHFSQNGRTISEYELEIELRKDERLSKLLDEYIIDKFGRLEIPILAPSKYPAKVVRALAYAGYLNKSVLQTVQRIGGRQ